MQPIHRWFRGVLSSVGGDPLAPAGRTGRIVTAALLGLLVVGSGAAVTVDRVQAVPAGAVFRFGDRVMTQSEFDQRIKLLGAFYGVVPPRDPATLDRFRRDTAKAVAVTEVLEADAQRHGIVIADKTANDQLTTLIDRSFPQGRQVFDQKLAGIGLGPQQVLEEIKRQLVDARLFDQVTKDVPTPTDQDVAGTYQARRAEMVTPEQRHLRNIVVATQDQAAQVVAQLSGGADFATVAGQSSLDDTTKAKGGDLGGVIRDQLEKAYGDAAFGAAPNGVFGPVQTGSGWNVGQVLEVTPAVPLSLDQVREQLRAGMLNERKQAAYNSWLGTTLRAAHVRYADPYRPADPDAAVPPQAPGDPGR
jgi:peptidyl-prolyl cis-trans isomerase C